MKRDDSKKKSIARPSHRGARARSGGQTLQTYTIGALPIVNRLLDRMQLESFLKKHLPRGSRRLAVRRALGNSEFLGLPLYPEHRECRAPTTRRIVGIFETVQRHQLTGGDGSQTFVTELTPSQSQVANGSASLPVSTADQRIAIAEKFSENDHAMCEKYAATMRNDTYGHSKDERD